MIRDLGYVRFDVEAEEEASNDEQFEEPETAEDDFELPETDQTDASEGDR